MRLTARFVQVETGEIVGTAKVDGRASEFLRLQDKVTAELLRSAGMQQHIKKIVERARAPLKSMRTLELYGDAVVAENDEKKAELLKLAVAEDSSFTYAASDLAALEKRMKQYEALSRKKQDEKTRALLDEFAKETDPQKQAMMVVQRAERAAAGASLPHAWSALGRSLAAGPAAAATHARRGVRVDEMALYYVIIAENMLKQRDAVLRDGEDFLRRFPASSFFARRQGDHGRHHPREARGGAGQREGQGADGVACRRSSAGTCATWRPVRASSHQYREAQRLFHACFAVGGARQGRAAAAHPGRRALGDWAAARHGSRRAGEERPRDVSQR